MKPRILVLTILAAALMTGGCIETHVLVSVKKDGSGTIHESVKMSKQVLAPLQEMAEQMKQAAEENGAEVEADAGAIEPFNEESIREHAAKLGKGVRYVSHEMIDSDASMGYNAVYAFSDINTVRVDQNPAASVPDFSGGESAEDDEGIEMTDNGDYMLFSFTRGNPATLTIRTPAGDTNESDEGMADEETGMEDQEQGEEQGGEQEIEQMKEFMRDMKIVVQVAVEGKIAETNATYVDGSTVTLMDIDFNKLIDDPEMLAQLKNAEEMDPKAAKEMLKKIPGLRVETEEEVTVKFK